MNWPFVSRTAYDIAMDWNRELREKNDRWEDHVRRITRKQEGMTEVPREPKKPVEPIPVELERVIMRFASEQTRTDIRNHARIAHHRDDKEWSEIQHELEASLSA